MRTSTRCGASCSRRRSTLEDEAEPVDTQGYLLTVAEDVVANTVDEYCPPNGDRDDWDVAGLKDRVEDVFGLDESLLEEVDAPGLRNEAIADTVWTSVTEAYHAKEEMVGKELFRVPDDVRPQLVPEERLAEIMTAPNEQQLRSPAAPSWSRSRAASCCRSSTSSGRITSTASTT